VGGWAIEQGSTGKAIAISGLAIDVAMSLVGYVHSVRAKRAKHDAFSTYERSLRERLRICGNGPQAAACP
jgi:hypothetical protein